MKFLGVIPARLASTRMKEKVLRPLAGKPLIQHVWERCRRCGALEDIVIACDDEKIARAVKKFGGTAVMTRADHPNGTSRIAEVARLREAEVYINIQGDEPLIKPEAVDRLAAIFAEEPETQVATLCVPKSDPGEFEDPNVVKVVKERRGQALYFSRAPVPFPRDRKGKGKVAFFKHLGIYAYRRNFLFDFVGWAETELEKTEKLEQLRVLERGQKMRVIEVPFDSIGVDTEEDLARVEKLMKKTGS